jgi:hypothetical protein
LTITLDGKTLTVLSLSESVSVVGTQWDAWENEAYDRKAKIYGITREWSLECIEQDVTWTNSLVKYFGTVAQNGLAVAFVSDEPAREVSGTDVYVLGVDLDLTNLGGENIRKFTLKLQET